MITCQNPIMKGCLNANQCAKLKKTCRNGQDLEKKKHGKSVFINHCSNNTTCEVHNLCWNIALVAQVVSHGLVHLIVRHKKHETDITVVRVEV